MILTYSAKGRRLYSKTLGQFVTYTKLYEYIKAGNTIKVTCTKRKVDLTTMVLKKCLELKPNLYDDEIYRILQK